MWRTEWTSKFDGLDVYIWMEPDQGGTALVKKVAKDLSGVKVIQPCPKDIGDAHLQGYDVVALVDEARDKAMTAQCALRLAESAEERKKAEAVAELQQIATQIDTAEGLARYRAVWPAAALC